MAKTVKKASQQESEAICLADDIYKETAPWLKVFTGSEIKSFSNVIMTQAFHSVWLGKDASIETKEFYQAAVLTALADLSPTCASEGMLAAQIVALHMGAMECFRRAALAEQTAEGRNLNLKHGARMAALCSDLTTSLRKRQGKADQKVVVEHVHVYQGGQAIVGQVTAGGRHTKKEDQPHAKQIHHAQSAALPGQNTHWDAMPITRNT